VEGEVKHPDTMPYSENLTVADALIRAGGFTRWAYTKSVDVVRSRIVTPGKDTIVSQIAVPLGTPIDFGAEASRSSFVLQDRDRIIVHPDPAVRDPQYVLVSGKVAFPGRYALIRPEERLSEILGRAGGPLPEAFLEGSHIYRENKSVVADFKRAMKKRNKGDDVILHPGDSIVVVTKPNAVSVSGEVNNEGLYSFIEGRNVADYVQRAGGFTDSVQYVLLTKPNGETKKMRRALFGSPQVPDGSSIVVIKKHPVEKQEKQGPTVTEVVRDGLAIITSAVTIIVLVVQLAKMK
jgi:polysaccharide export outer membrane protein